MRVAQQNAGDNLQRRVHEDRLQVFDNFVSHRGVAVYSLQLRVIVVQVAAVHASSPETSRAACATS